MVARVGGYYGATFRGERVVTQGKPMSPTILNVVVDTVVCHWESLLVASQGEKEGGGISGDEEDGSQTAGRTIRGRDDLKQWVEEGLQRLRVKSAFFYVKDGVVASTDPGWLQLAFDLLTGLFDQVGLRKNF